ncbi:aminotransferase class I/II-fold pyridoxal phosphate-dependent enzyme [Erysipelothrix sp. HDW6C]|uniref:DegT/DnrJ/EryC1/StrS family aminotransferase n=1 Tax=Erysipelothrix sp. HDW6C TaxID=2714930 RepID=UPI00140A9A59|nr:aminotransferase class I/II-fold pyridoxal phosphate-dependent enzyme [Erysipelothrix sp. HDW6C]QIK70025.1 aminotransferase class I/II-fold pyridoxal phosphate-dependent enzyme [Erysipelothrix sp. HDW6C]
MEKRILLSSPHMSDEGYELAFVQEAFDTNWIAPLGENVNQFENELAERVHAKGAVALSSGTAAIHLALKLADVSEGDVVLCQSLTFSATANPILYQNAVPVFIDSDEGSWNMDPVALEEALIKYPNTKAVLIVHLYGLCARLDEIVALCKRYNVTLIEDAAESLGSTYHGKDTGTFGNLGIYSFNGNKIITTSGGGMLVSSDVDEMKKARFWATQSREPELHYEHKELGFNYRMSNVVAGIGRGQLKVLDLRVAKKNEIYNRYKDALSSIEGVSFMPLLDNTKPNYWLSCMVLDPKLGSPVELIHALDSANVEARPIWKPMHLQPFFSEFDYVGNGFGEQLFNTGLCLPSDSKMTTEEQDYVIEVIKGSLGRA